MEYKDIKVGETYNVRVKVIGIAKNGVDAIYVDDEGIAGLHIGKRRVGILSPISPENGIKNTESAPKYNPCRMFKKGDRVEVVKYKGRIASMETPIATLAMVIEDEDEAGWIYIQAEGSNKIDSIDPAYLELVTPVEEQEPYYIEEELGTIAILSKKDPIFHKCWHYAGVNSGVIAKEAAQAECDRLNEQYRKEEQQ